MKYWVAIWVLFLTSCFGMKTQVPVFTETVVPVSQTPQIVQVTRIITIEQTVAVTATPMPALAQNCFNTAMTQREINGCAALERELADAELEKTISQIEFSLDKKQAFDKLQAEWRQQIENDCEFFYGQLVDDGNGHFYYRGGSMSPMRISLCVASRIKQRIDELKLVYLTPDV